MSKHTSRKMLLTLASIKSNELFPCIYTVTFKLKDPKTTCLYGYIYFNFSSFDLMYLHLKSLLKSCNINSIDELTKNEYPVIISYFNEFISPPQFNYLLTDDEKIWPDKDIRGHFLLD